MTETQGRGLAAANGALDAFVAASMHRHGTPGVTLALTTAERTLRIGTYGYADLAGQVPVAPETLFEFGSIGKSFTALVLLRLRERGMVDFGVPVTTYLPWFVVPGDYPPITIHHLLCHAAGLVGGTDISLDGRFEVWALRERELSGAPGAHFRYSNVGYKTLGFLIEDLLGASYGEVVGREILAPLGMEQTIVPITNEARPRLAVGYGRLHEDRPSRADDPRVPLPWFEVGTADGGIAAPAGDMAIYLRLMLNRGVAPGGHLVSEESFALMTQGHMARAFGDETAAYGYGWMHLERDGHRYEGHGGGMVGYYSALVLDRVARLGAFVAVNGPGDPFAIATHALRLMAAALAGETLPEPPTDDSRVIPHPAALAGSYEGERGRLTLAPSADGGVTLTAKTGSVALEARGADDLFADLAPFDRFLFRVIRDGETIVALAHGAEWYAREGVMQPEATAHPPEWTVYPGHYRCWNPWGTGFRVVLRRGHLLYVGHGGHEERLHPLPDGTFRLGDAPSPSRIHFDAVAGGQALRAVYDGQAYYRQPER